MKTFTVPLSQNLIDELEESFLAGPIYNDDGIRLLTEATVARQNGMTISIYADEHPPPHFHVRRNGEGASFNVADGSRLPNVKGLEKYEKNIRKCYDKNRCVIIEAWNRNRPSDCPVGTVSVPRECLKPS